MPDSRDLEYGRIAVKNNFLTQEQFDDCLRMKEGLRARYGKDYDLEQILFEKGLISDTQSEVIKKVLKRKVEGGPPSSVTRPSSSSSSSGTGTTTRRNRSSKIEIKPGSGSGDGLVEEEIDVGEPSSGRANVRCNYCGQENRFGQATCSRCARYLPQPGGTAARRLVVSRQKKGLPKGVWAAGAGVAGLLVVIVVLARSGGDPGDGTGQGNGNAPAAATPISARDVESVRDQIGRAEEARHAGDARVAWDRYRAAEREADGRLRSSAVADPRLADLRALHRQAVSAREAIVEDRRKALEEDLGRARKYLDEGDAEEGRGRARRIEEEARDWKNLLVREHLGSGPFERIEADAIQLADARSGDGSDPEAESLLTEFRTLSRNLLAIEDAGTWAMRERDWARLFELVGQLYAVLKFEDPRRAEVASTTEEVEERRRRITGEGSVEGPGEVRRALPPGPWDMVHGGTCPPARELAAGLAALLDPGEVIASDPELAAPPEYSARPLPASVRDRSGQPIGGVPASIQDRRSVVFQGEGAPSVAIDLAEIHPADVPALVQNLALERGDARSHLDAALLLHELGLADDARREFVEAVRLDRSLATEGIATIRPEEFYLLLDLRAGDEASARFQLGLWAREAFPEPARFLEQVDRARQADPETYGSPWMRLAVGLWLAEQRRWAEARSEVELVVSDAALPEPVRQSAQIILRGIDERSNQ